MVVCDQSILRGVEAEIADRKVECPSTKMAKTETGCFSVHDRRHITWAGGRLSTSEATQIATRFGYATGISCDVSE